MNRPRAQVDAHSRMVQCFLDKSCSFIKHRGNTFAARVRTQQAEKSGAAAQRPAAATPRLTQR
jgi:hypothetical protein